MRKVLLPSGFEVSLPEGMFVQALSPRIADLRRIPDLEIF